MRRWFRFSLRTLFVAMTLLACLACWLGYELNWIRQRQEAIQAGIAVPHTFAANQPIPAPPVGFRWLGEDGQGHLFVSPANFDRVCELFPEAEVMEYPPKRYSRQRTMALGGSRRISSAKPSGTRPARTPEP